MLQHDAFSKFDNVITVEDGCLMGGMGSAIVKFAADNGYQARIKRLGMPDEVIEHGSQDELYAECGYDTQSIVKIAISLHEKTDKGRSSAWA
jgi:1-deoxy-D-xylulose-5-phosphate synthase